jgi:hypothetical protein
VFDARVAPAVAAAVRAVAKGGVDLAEPSDIDLSLPDLETLPGMAASAGW